MGKHERRLIEKAEKIIIKILKSEKINDSDKKNHWFNHAIAIAKRLQKDFKKINSITHLGNRYDNTGDILIISGGKKFFIEIKMSDTKEGIGTKANISQDALTENNLFSGTAKSWSEFRGQKNHEKWVQNYLNKFKNYPNKISDVDNLIKQKEEKARYLRNLKNKNIRARKILEAIHAKDRKEKLDYLSYLSNKKQNQEMIKRFLLLITLGIHKQEELKDLIRQQNFFREIENLLIYYSNSHGNKIKIKRNDVGKTIESLLKKFSSFKIVFPKGLTQCKIVGMENKKEIPLLGAVLHWKNIAQGIKTPCLNIFDLTRS